MFLRYTLVWIALAVLAIGNGLLREKTYGALLSELRAHQVSTLTAILSSGALVYGVQRFWPFESESQAWAVGVAWLLATVLFEFSFGHYVAGHSWSRLLQDYDILRGRVWLVFLAWVLVMPVVIHKLAPR